MQDYPPQDPRHFDNTRVPKKLLEIAAHGRCRWCVRRTEIDQKNTEGLREPVFELWFRLR